MKTIRDPVGSKSPFAIVQSFNLESYKDGILYKCLWYKNQENRPTLTFISKTATTEPNGLKYIINVTEQDINLLHDAIKTQLHSFRQRPKIYTNIDDETSEISDFISSYISYGFQYENISTLTLKKPPTLNYNKVEFKVRIGDVIYPLPSNVVSSIPYAIYNGLSRFFWIQSQKGYIVIDIPIGSVTLPMSREYILDTPDNTSYLNQFILDSLLSLTAHIDIKVNSFLGIDPTLNPDQEILLSNKLKGYDKILSYFGLDIIPNLINNARYFIKLDLPYLDILNKISLNVQSHKIIDRISQYLCKLGEVIPYTVEIAGRDGQIHSRENSTSFAYFSKIRYDKNEETCFLVSKSKYEKLNFVLDYNAYQQHFSKKMLLVYNDSSFSMIKLANYIKENNLEDYIIYKVDSSSTNQFNVNINTVFDLHSYLFSYFSSCDIRLVKQSQFPKLKRNPVTRTSDYHMSIRYLTRDGVLSNSSRDYSYSDSLANTKLSVLYNKGSKINKNLSLTLDNIKNLITRPLTENKKILYVKCEDDRLFNIKLFKLLNIDLLILIRSSEFENIKTILDISDQNILNEDQFNSTVITVENDVLQIIQKYQDLVQLNSNLYSISNQSLSWHILNTNWDSLIPIIKDLCEDNIIKDLLSYLQTSRNNLSSTLTFHNRFILGSLSYFTSTLTRQQQQFLIDLPSDHLIFQSTLKPDQNPIKDIILNMDFEIFKGNMELFLKILSTDLLKQLITLNLQGS